MLSGVESAGVKVEASCKGGGSLSRTDEALQPKRDTVNGSMPLEALDT